MIIFNSKAEAGFLTDIYAILMTNLDSLLKSRDITLPTKVHLVKAMVFPVVMYGCESWTVKKAERRRSPGREAALCRGEPPQGLPSF